MAQQKDLLAEAAKYAAKEAVKKVLISAGSAVAPYIGAGCLIVLAVFLLVALAGAIFIIIAYYTCQEYSTAIKGASLISGFLPESMTPSSVQALSMFEPFCDIFKQ